MFNKKQAEARHPPDVGGVMGLLQETGLIARETRVRY